MFIVTALVAISIGGLLGLAWLYFRFEVEVKALELYDEWVADEEERFWHIIRGANHRRKRVEKMLRKERTKYAKLYKQHQSLVADVATELLTLKDREEVTKGLTRKL